MLYSIFSVFLSSLSLSNNTNPITFLSAPPPGLCLFNNLPLSFSTQFPCVFLHVFLSFSLLPSFLPYLLNSLISRCSPPTAPLLSGCQIKVKIFLRVLGSAFLFLFFQPPSPNYRIFLLSSGGGISDWARVRKEIFAVSDLSGFLWLIIPHWAQLWHYGGCHKSSDSCCWASADPGDSFPFLVIFATPSHSFFLSFSLLLLMTFYSHFTNFVCITLLLKPFYAFIPCFTASWHNQTDSYRNATISYCTFFSHICY